MHAEVLLGRVDRDALDGLVQDAVDLARDDLRLADRQLEALAAHLLDEDGELELAAALHLPRVGRLGRQDAERDVADELLRAGGSPPGSRSACSPSRPASGDVLMPIVTESDGSSTEMTGSGRGSSGSASVSPIVTSGMPATAMISPGPASSASTRSSASVDVELRHLRALDRPVRATPRDLLAARGSFPCSDPAEREPADVGRRVEVRDERLQRVALLVGRRGDVLEDEIEQRPEVGLERVGVGVERCATRLRVAVDDRELDLALVRVEVEEELVDLVHDGVDPRVGAIDLVDDEDHREARLERLAQHEPRLRQWALRSRRRAGARRRPSSARARPRRRSRRGRACR